jgi:hypothetical protein
MTVESTSCLPVVAEMSRVRWPLSPTARSCGCLHRGSNAQAVSKTGEVARSHVLMASVSCVARRPARLGGHLVGAGEGADGARVRVCTCRADRKLRALHAGRAGRHTGGKLASGRLVCLGSKRFMTKLIAGWIVLPAL